MRLAYIQKNGGSSPPEGTMTEPYKCSTAIIIVKNEGFDPKRGAGIRRTIGRFLVRLGDRISGVGASMVINSYKNSYDNRYYG